MLRISWQTFTGSILFKIQTSRQWQNLVLSASFLHAAMIAMEGRHPPILVLPCNAALQQHMLTHIGVGPTRRPCFT